MLSEIAIKLSADKLSEAKAETPIASLSILEGVTLKLSADRLSIGRPIVAPSGAEGGASLGAEGGAFISTGASGAVCLNSADGVQAQSKMKANTKTTEPVFFFTRAKIHKNS
jgi:hypothetical protein